MAQVSLGVARERGESVVVKEEAEVLLEEARGQRDGWQLEGQDVLSTSAFIFTFHMLSETFFLVSCSSNIYFKSDTAFAVGYPPETTPLKWV